MKYTQAIEHLLDVRILSSDEAYCLCPFHEDSNPSFAVNQDTGLWICHGCGERGNWKALTERLGAEKVTTGLDSVRDRIQALKTQGEEIRDPDLPEAWLKTFMPDQGYWTGRGLDYETLQLFGLGYDFITRYGTIPLRKYNNQLLGVIRRATEPQQHPKYVYPQGFKKARELFGSWLIKDRHAVLVEGPLDAIAVWEAGHQGLAIYGSVISDNQIALLKRLYINSVTIITDNDTVGRKARSNLIEALNGFIIRIPTDWPEAVNDPMDMPRDQLRHIINTSNHIWNMS